MNDRPISGQLIPAESIHQEPTLAVSLARAEIDQQISTARAYPRSIDRAVKNIITLATLDEETAEECIYALPRGGKPITGPSARLAEIIASQWGNNRVSARVVHVDRTEKYVEAEGLFHDLENNSATTARVRRRLSDKGGRLLSEDMIIVTGNAACAIAKRNAVLGGVPKGVWRRAYEYAAQVIAGTAETLVVTREKTMKAFAAFGVAPDRVCAALGLAGVDDIKVEHVPTLRGMYAALKNGEATVEEMFAELKPAASKAVLSIPEDGETRTGAITDKELEKNITDREPDKKPDTSAQSAPASEPDAKNSTADAATKSGEKRASPAGKAPTVEPVKAEAKPDKKPDSSPVGDPVAFLNALENAIARCDTMAEFDAVVAERTPLLVHLAPKYRAEAESIIASAMGN